MHGRSGVLLGGIKNPNGRSGVLLGGIKSPDGRSGVLMGIVRSPEGYAESDAWEDRNVEAWSGVIAKVGRGDLSVGKLEKRVSIED
ncbi:hypothetical protein ACLOJK_039160 [Asimina triloba]